MFKSFLTALILVCSFIVNAEEALRVGYYDNPPKVYRNFQGEPAGYFVEILSEIAKSKDIELEFVYGKWQDLISRLSISNIDILMDVAWSEERAEKFSFNNIPVIESWVQFFSFEHQQIFQVNDLNMKRVAVLGGSVQHEYLENVFMDKFDISYELLVFDELNKVINAVLTKNADAMVADRFFYFNPQRPLEIQPGSLVLSPNMLFFAFSPQTDPSLIRYVDSALQKMKNDPESVYYQSLAKWVEMSEYGNGFSYFNWLSVFLLIILIVAGVLLYKLKKRLKKRSEELVFRNSILESANKMLEELLEERGRSEQALTESKRSFEGLFKESADAFALLRDGVFVDCNQATLQLFRLKSREALLGKRPWDLSPPVQPSGSSSAELARAILVESINKGSAKFEWVHLNAQGETFHTEIVLTLITFQNEKMFHVSWRDISDRVAMEKSLRDSEERYRLLVENQNDLIVKVDKDGHFQFVSPSYCRLFGKNQSELLGQKFLPLVHPDDRESTEAEMKKLFQPPYTCTLQQRALTVQGWRWLEWTDNSILNQNKEVDAIIGVGRDITLQKQAELDLLQSEKRWKFALEGSGDGLWDWNIETNKIFFSSNYKKMLGYTEDEVEHSFDAWEKFVHPDDLEKAMEKVNEHMAGITESYSHIFRMRSRSGKYLWILDRGKIIERDVQGEPVRMIGTHTDVSEQVENQQNLQNQNIFIQTILDNLPIGLAVNNFESGMASYMNKKFEQVYGWPKEKLISIDTFFQCVYPDEDYRNFIRKKVEEDINSGNIDRMQWNEIMATTAEGETRFVKATNIPLYEQNIMISTVMDVTQQVESRKKQKQWQDLLQYIIKHDPSAIAVHDKDLKYLFVSKRYMEDYGVSEIDIIGKHHYDVIPDIPQKWRDVHQRSLKGEVLKKDEDLFIRNDGNTQYTRWECRPWFLEDKSVGGIVLYTEIITERKLVEINLQDQRDHLQLLMKISRLIGEAPRFDDAVRYTLKHICDNSDWEIAESWVPDNTTNRLVINEESWYTSRENLVGFFTSSKNYTFALGEGLPGTAWDKQEPVWVFDPANADNFLRTKEATIFNLKTGVAIPIMAEGQLISVMVFFTRKEIREDAFLTQIITGTAMHLGEMFRRKLAEEEMYKLNAELEERVDRRTQQLQVVNNELEAFSYSVSHDLRAPLRAINGFTRILLEEYSPSFDQEAMRLFGVITENAGIMDKLITDLLEFSRSGRNIPRKTKVDMGNMVREVFDSLMAVTDKKSKYSLIIQELPKAMADSALIKQVWHNLLSNAVKYSSETEASQIEVGGYQQEGLHIFYVKDNGIGFDNKYKDKLFLVFHRLHKRGEYEGTGVGLALVQRIISRHEGEVWAEGDPGKGACFWFSLPLEDIV